VNVFGANQQVRLVRTDATGKATFTYTGVHTGADLITATAPVGGTTLSSNEARVAWSAGKHSTRVSLNPAPEGAIVGTPTTLSAQMLDLSLNPIAPLAGLTVQFTVGGQSCNAATNAGGVASCQVTVPLIGSYALTATFAGNATYLATSEALTFDVLAAGPPPCFAFNDVDASSVFCTNVEWMRNRAVTLGCTTTLYCPIDFVTRLQMAAFMNRLGTTLGGEVLFVGAQPGALALDAEPVVCQTTDLTPTNFDRRIVVDASFSALGAASMGFAADAVASFDAGVTWVPLASVGNRTFAAASHWGHVRARGVADIVATDTVRFGLSIGRGGLAGAANPTNSTCKLRAIVISR